MSLKEFIRLLKRHWLLLVMIPMITAASVYLFARHKNKSFHSDTVIYTGISTGYKIDGDNNSAGGGWNETSTAFDNLNALINSRDTKVEVALRLLASHLFSKSHNPNAWDYTLAPPTPISPLGALGDKLTHLRDNLKQVLLQIDHKEQKEILPRALQRELTGKTLEETTQNVMAYYSGNHSNTLYKLLNSEHPVYSEKALEAILSNRIKDSDLLKIEYTTLDPEVCRKTLEILTDVFIRKHKELYAGQNETVIGYFDQSSQKAYEKLQAAEQKLLEFHKANNIVDYDKQIISTTEDKQLSLEKYNDLELKYAGASSALRSMESRLNGRGASNLKSQEIIRLRTRLSDITSQLTELEMQTNNRSRAENANLLARLKQESARVSEELKATIDSYYSSSSSVEGAVSDQLLKDYSANMVLVEELRGQLAVMRRQRNAYEGRYNKLVPLGAEIRKIKREIEIAEQEYLSQVEGAKQSRLSEQNSELAAILKVVDPPYLPHKPEQSKLIFLVLGGLFGAFMLTAGSLLASDMLNHTLKNPTLANRITRYPIIGILPKVSSQKEQHLLDVKRAEEQLSRQIVLKYQQRNQEAPFAVGVLSSLEGEGKSAVCASLAKSLQELGIHTHLLFPDDHQHFEDIETRHVSFYSPLAGVSKELSLTDLVGKRVHNKSVVIIEFPAVLENTYPVSLLRDLDLALVTVNANRTWEVADRTIFKNLQKVMSAPIEMVLSSVLPEYVVDFIGARVKPTKKRELLNLPEHPKQALLNP